MNELKSYTEYNVASPTTDFTIGFDYTYGVDAVNVYVDGVLASTAGYVVTQINATTIQLDPAVTSGVVLLQRETNIDTPLHVFSAGAKFIAVNMDEDFKQVRQAQQEVRDVTERTAGKFDSLSTDATAALDAANAAVTTANSIDAKATEALSKATTAEANAATALSTANTALSTANGIDAKATTALSNSTTALNTANGVDAKATQAQQDASATLSIVSTQKGAANGIATLDANAVVPSTQLPSSSTIRAGIVQLNNTLTDTSTTQALTAAQGKVLQDSKLNASLAFGVGQTLQNVTASRALNVNYTNTTGRTMTLYVLYESDVDSAQSEIKGWINNNLVVSSTAVWGSDSGITLIIPAGATYKVTEIYPTSGGYAGTKTWWELK